MPLPPGHKLGHYEILSLIGAGGMGEVYRARDPRVGRDVAIKVSADRFSDRFDREARAVAALNHPNICTLYDVGPDYLVMEYVEGEAPKGPLPFGIALNYAHQIADALEAAHEKGITHRDLKPANIKVRPDGTVKVLDFGLAKTNAAPASSGGENSPTLSMAATQGGAILGTAGYMAPEQARGKPVDKRADIWAFGVVFYELLTGERLFQGEDVTETLARVIQAEPKLDAAPGKVHRLLKKCLEKDPRKRLRDIGDVWELLEFDAPVRGRDLQPVQWLWPASAASLAIVAAIAFWSPWRSSDSSLRPLIRVDMDLGPDVTLSESPSGSRVIISPDGTRLAYYSGNPRRLFTRKLDSDKAVELPGTEGDAPFFSPDGQWIGITGNGPTKKVSVEGGAVFPIASTSGPGASWGDNNEIVIGLNRIPAGGGDPIPATKQREKRSDPGGSFGYVPQVLPGSKAVLFTSRRDFGDVETATVNVLADGSVKTLVPGATGRYVPSGHLLYNKGSTLYAIPFDLKRLETYGNEVPILNDVANIPGTGTAQYDVSRDQHGTLVYQRAGEAEREHRSTIQLLDTFGKKQALIAKPGAYGAVRFSQEGNKLLYVEGPTVGLVGGGQVSVWDLHRELSAPLAPAGKAYRRPLWYPGGKYVLFALVGQGVFWTRSDGAGEPQPLNPEDKRNLNPWSITQDGKWLAYTSGSNQIEVVQLSEENGRLKSGMPDHMTGNEPAFSPDGKWLAYSSSVSGATGGKGQGRAGQPEGTQLYVQAFRPGTPGEPQRSFIANNGGEPKWLPDGHTLIFRSGDQIMAVDYAVEGNEFSPGKPRVWIDKLGGTMWDLDPRMNNRVAVVTPEEAPAAAKPQHEIVLLLNFFDYLRQRVPVGN